MSCEAGVMELGPEQKKVLSRKKGPVLLLSGTGTGKTTVLAHRYNRMAETGPPGSVVVLCPGMVSSRRMRKLIEHIGGTHRSDAWIHSFEEFSLRLLREHLMADVSFCVYDEDDRELLIRGILKEFKMHEALFKGIAARIAALKSRGVTPEQFISGKDSYGFDEKLARIYGRYQEELRRNRALDFDDLVSEVVSRLENDPTQKKKVCGRFKHVLVDDLQDVTPTQYELVRTLAGTGTVMFVAGDNDQSIFGHRGADTAVLDRFEKDHPGLSLVQFSKNYRCSGNVLNAAVAVISDDPSYCEKPMKPVRETEDMPVYSCTGDEVEEAQHIAYLLKDLYLKDRYRYGEMCVLYRIPSQGKVISEVLKAEGIPVQMREPRSSFFVSPEVKDVLCYLRVLCNPSDNLSFERIVNRPARGIGEATLNRLRQEARKKELSLFETIEQSSKGSKTLAKLLPLLKMFRRETKAAQGASDVVPILRKLLDNSGYADWILEQGGEGETAARRISELMAMAEGKTVREFLDRAVFRSGMADSTTNHEAVQLLTIHQASGMEFSVVFLAGLEEGMLPYRPSRRANQDIEEERRLTYVAMTRAKDRLFLSGARRRKTFTGLQSQQPSRFVECLPETLCKRFERSTRTEAGKEPVRKKRRSLSGDGAFPVGARVRHTTWGVGVVRDCNGQGETARVTVNFPSVGIKRLAVKFANLERV